MTAKEQIIELFRRNVLGKRPNVDGKNSGHDGKYGHWLEEQFGIIHNGDNEPDIMGYELKNETTSKTTFGDWSANVYIYDLPEFAHIFRGASRVAKRDVFLSIFGKNSERVAGRFSWSGEACPKISDYNGFGQKLFIENGNRDIVAVYSYTMDRRPNKALIIPKELQKDNLVIARWYGDTYTGIRRRKTDKCMRERVEDKFNDNGWFTCKTDTQGRYVKICFGNPVSYDDFLFLIEQGLAFFDSGMHTGNNRPYQEWRMNNSIWDSLIIEEYQ